MTEIWLVRHGQTDWNIEGRWQGHADIPLNLTGVEQARGLAAKLAENGHKFQAIFSSDLMRAYRTAQEIGEALNLPVHKDRRLREISKGDWEGMLVSQVSELSTEATRQRREDPLYSRAPNGESLVEVAARLANAADEIARAQPIGPVLVVTHGLALAVLLCLANQWPLQQAYDRIPGNAAAQVIHWKDPSAASG
jgi:broad specificity phosphatase PhoE